jgi:predicted PurR-regulated permease PerM
MTPTPHENLYKTLAVLSLLVLSVVILIFAKDFLIPITFAAMLSMLLLPITKWLQGKGIHKAISTLLAVLVLVSFFSLVIFFVSWQLTDIASDAAKLEQQLAQKFHEAKIFISEQFGISPEKQQEMIKQQQASSGKGGSMVTGLLSGLGSFITNSLLVLVYIFLFIYFRSRLKEFIIRLVKIEDKSTTLNIIDKAQKVSMKYLSGLFLMIVCLWVMYGIGFSIIGIKNAIFFAILCGLLEIVPFVGNLTGTALTIAMSLVQGGSMQMVIGILVVYGTVQFIQTYLLEPIVVGSEVSLNPLFTIIGLIAGELLWGIPGMVLAIPLLGIAKIVCDHIEPLKPVGYLIGDAKKKDDSSLKKNLKLFGVNVESKD